MLIHKAWYGPQGGHAFIASTDDGLQSVFRQAAWLTDLPGTASSGLEWRSYFRTFIYESYFVLVHTRPNNEVTRAGMVDSVAAFIPLNDLQRIPNIRAVAEDLARDHENDERKPFEVDDQGIADTSTALPPLLLRIAEALMAGAKRPLVCIGQDGFDDSMLELLQRVPATLRKEILFSIGIVPEHVGGSIAVCVPHQLAAKFASSPILPDSKIHESMRSSTSVLLNLSNGQVLRAFAEAVGFEFDSLKSLNLLEDGFRLWSLCRSVSDAIALVRFMAAKSGESATAIEMRAKALSKLIDLVTPWTLSDVLSLRNLDLVRFEDGVKLQDKLCRWTLELFWKQASAPEQDAKVLEQAVQRLAKPWWNSGVLDGVVAAFVSHGTPASALTWTAIQQFPQALEQLLDLLGTVKDGLHTLALHTPNVLDKTTADAVSQSSAKRGAWTLCGSALAACYLPDGALAKLVSFNPEKGARLPGIEAALSRASGKQVIDVAVQQDLPEVTAMAAKALAVDSRLLGNFDWSSPVWFDVLQQATSSSHGLVANLADRTKRMEEVVARGESSERIWRVIAETELADLYELSNRSRVWTLMPSTFRAQIVTATCKSWLTALESGTANTDTLEEPLRESVRAQLRESAFMPSLAQRAPAAFVRCLGDLYPLAESECLQLINSLADAWNMQFGPVVAISLGGLIQRQKWSRAALRVADLAKRRDDFLVVCKECLPLLSFWDRLLLRQRLGDHVELPAHEALTILEEELVRLYPQGPADQEVWSRSGGRNEELSFEGNGVAQWHRCIKQVGVGRCPKLSDLLRTALRDFSGNEMLQALQSSGVLSRS